MIRNCKDQSCQTYIDNLIKIIDKLRVEVLEFKALLDEFKSAHRSRVIEQGYRPINKLDTRNPPKGGSGVRGYTPKARTVDVKNPPGKIWALSEMPPKPEPPQRS